VLLLLPEGLKALKQVAKEAGGQRGGLDLRGAYLNLDGGFDSIYNRTCIFSYHRTLPAILPLPYP
jgi:hypothetical protein